MGLPNHRPLGGTTRCRLPSSAGSIIPPDTEEFALPSPSDEHEEVIDVLASGLHPRASAHRRTDLTTPRPPSYRSLPESTVLVAAPTARSYISSFPTPFMKRWPSTPSLTAVAASLFRPRQIRSCWLRQ